MVGPLGGVEVAGEGQLHGDVERELAAEPEQAAGAGDEVALHLGDAERGACVEATTRSQDSTISVPPARAGPSTAAMIGLVRSRCTMPGEAALLGGHARRRAGR